MHAHTSCAEINTCDTFLPSFKQVGKNLRPGSCPGAVYYPAPTEPDWSTNFRRENHRTPAGCQGDPLPNSSCKILAAWTKSESLCFKFFCRTDEIWAILELLLCKTRICPSLNSVNHQHPHMICSNRFCHLLLSWFPACALFGATQSTLQRCLNSLNPVPVSTPHSYITEKRSGWFLYVHQQTTAFSSC